jgi:hypothetical protein
MGSTTSVDPLDVACHNTDMTAEDQHMTLAHVVRHSFRPSEQLESLLHSFAPPESIHIQSSLVIKSLAVVALDGVRAAHYEYSQPLIDAKRSVEKHSNVGMPILPDIEVRKVGEKTLNILLGSDDKQSLYILNRELKQKLPEGTPLRNNADPQYSVYARLQSTVPLDDQQLIDAEMRFKQFHDQQHAKRILSIYPQGIVGRDQYIPTAQ